MDLAKDGSQCRLTMRSSRSIVLLALLSFVASGCDEPKKIMGKAWKDEWHGSCKVASSIGRLYDKNRIHYSRQHDIDMYDQIGECTSQKITDNLWFVKGIWYNNAMKADGTAPVPYEAVMYEDNNKRELAVQRHGTQYLICSIAIKGEDSSAPVRLNVCGDGRHIAEFKKQHSL